MKRELCKKSYTLVEMLAVMGISLLLVVIMMQVSVVRSSQVLHELYLLKTTCHAMQQLALASGKELFLTIDIANSSYQFQSVNGLKQYRELPRGIVYGIPRGTQGPPARPTHEIKSPCSFEVRQGAYTIRFSPSGAMSAGALYLMDKGSGDCVALASGVSGLTAIRVYILREGLWKELINQHYFPA